MGKRLYKGDVTLIQSTYTWILFFSKYLVYISLK